MITIRDAKTYALVLLQTIHAHVQLSAQISLTDFSWPGLRFDAKYYGIELFS